MSLAAALNYHARDYYWEHAWAQQVYSAVARAQARRAERRGNLYGALVRYADAARRIRHGELQRERLAEFAGFLRRHLESSASTPWIANPFLRSFLASEEAAERRASLRALSSAERLSLRGNIILLKAPANGERGVILVQYTPLFFSFLVNFDLPQLAAAYSLVLEPSWSLYPEPYWGLFATQETPVVTQVIREDAAQAVKESGLPLLAMPIGSQDWIDPDSFHPLPGEEKEFDVVMIANFMRLKRHELLFRVLQQVRPRRLKVAIIGRTWERTRAEFDALMRRYGVFEDCTVFQGLGPAEINRILNRSKVKVLLSKREGGNRALMEAWAAGVPCVVYKHIVGPRPGDVNPMTGMFSEDHELREVLLHAIENYREFRPREWFLAHTGCRNSTRKLNELLRQEAQRRGEPWTCDIMAKVNRIRLEYLDAQAANALAPAWQRLEPCLAPL